MKQTAASFNTLKQTLILKGNQFTKEEFIQGLKTCGIPSTYYVWAQFCKEYLQCRQGNRHNCEVNTYSFVNKDPMYYRHLESLVKRAGKLNTKHKQKSLNKQSESNTELEEAIKLLKEHGYKIYAPKTEYVEL